MSKRSFLLFTIYFSLATILVGCSTIYNPATGKREVIFIDTKEEIAIGKNVAIEVLRQYKLLNDQETQAYVRMIGQRIASVSDRKDLRYSFTVLESKELNAFALPGGGVYITSTLVERLEEDEIAAVLAHEVGHIAARHSVKRIQSKIGYELLMNVALYNVSKDDPKLARTVSKGTGSMFSIVMLGYSRQDELLGDKLAIRYVNKAGYNPWSVVTMLKKLKRYSKEGTPWKPMVVLRSHPYLEDRMRVAEAEVALLID